MSGRHLAVVGAGSWGTTLANLLRRNGHEVRLWARELEVVESIATRRENTLFLPGCQLDDGIEATGDVCQTVEGADLVVSAPPSHAVACG